MPLTEKRPEKTFTTEAIRRLMSPTKCPKCQTPGEVIESCKSFTLSECPECGETWTWENPDLVIPEAIPFDWSSAPTSRNYLYYGREEMDAFHEEIKTHVNHLNNLYAAAITLLGRTREEVKEQRSIVHHLDTVLDDVVGWENEWGHHINNLGRTKLETILARRVIQEGRQN